MMSKQHEARFQSAGDVAHMLAKWLEARHRDGLSESSGIGLTKRVVGPPPRRVAGSRSVAMPAWPPRRSEKPVTSDDTVSNMQHETIKGTPGQTPSSTLAGKSHPQHGSGILGQPGSSNVGRSGPNRAVRGGSSILG